MTTPGTSSGTFLFQPDNAQVTLAATSRLGIDEPLLTRNKLISMRMELQMELVRWSNLGPNSWKTVSGTINPVIGTSVYTLPTNLVTLTDLYWTVVNGNGAGFNSDRIMIPLTRTQYAMIPNKLQTGNPTQYWFQRLIAPQITVWQPPAFASPAYLFSWYGLQRIQDAGTAMGETPDIVYRAYDALVASLAYRFYPLFPEKFPPATWGDIDPILKGKRDEAWMLFAGNDIEPGPIIVQPNLSVYGRMG